MRTLVCLSRGDRMVRLAKVKSIPKHFAKVLLDGTDKTIDTAVWLTWRMTRDDDFCLRLFRNLDMVSKTASSHVCQCSILTGHCADEGSDQFGHNRRRTHPRTAGRKRIGNISESVCARRGDSTRTKTASVAKACMHAPELW